MSFGPTAVVLTTIESHFHRLATEVYDILIADTENAVIGSFKEDGVIKYAVLANRKGNTIRVEVCTEDAAGRVSSYHANFDTRNANLNSKTFSAPAPVSALVVLQLEAFVKAIDLAEGLVGTQFAEANPAVTAPVDFSVDDVVNFAYEINNGESHTFVLDPEPDNAVIWRSSQPSVASIHPDTGVLTTHRGGSTNITVGPFVDGTQEYISFTVGSIQPVHYTLDKTTMGAYVGSSFKIPVTPTAPFGDSVWTSSDTDIVTVDYYGTVRIQGAGNATITGHGLTLNIVGKSVDVDPEVPETTLDLSMVINSSTPYGEYAIFSTNHPNKAQLIVTYAGRYIEVPWDFDYTQATDFISSTEPTHVSVRLDESFTDVDFRRMHYAMVASNSAPVNDVNFDADSDLELSLARAGGYSSTGTHIGFNVMLVTVDNFATLTESDNVIELTLNANTTGPADWAVASALDIDPLVLDPDTAEPILFNAAPGYHYSVTVTDPNDSVTFDAEALTVTKLLDLPGGVVNVREFESMTVFTEAITFSVV